MSDWEKVDMNPTWNFEEEKELVGVYVNKEENVGRNNSNLYTFQRQDGSTVGVWGNTLLDERFKNLNLGDEVKIVYLGTATSERTGREYRNFEVYRKKNPST